MRGNMICKQTKTALLSGAAALTLITTSAATPAFGQSEIRQSAQTYEFDIPAMAMDSALNRFGVVADRQVMYSKRIVEGKIGNAVSGEMAPHMALAQLLDGSGLIYDVTPQNVFLVRPAQEAALQVNPERIYLAGLQEDGQGAEAVAALDTRGDKDEEPERDTIIVTGTTIRGVYPESQPLDVYTAEDIALSGATTLERFLEVLPQNVNNLSAGAVDLGPGEGRVIGGGGIDLRGLGVGATLVLLNGRRLTAPDGLSPDTSLIPLGAVERVEVLTDGASAIYGSDAIAGVVNIILRDEFEGIDTSASYGGATRGGHDRTQADISAGTSWGSGSGFISYSYATQSNLDVGERDFASEARSPQSLRPDELKHSVFGAIDQRVTDRLNLFGSAFYSTRDSFLNSTSSFFETTIEGDQEQLFLSGGLDYEVSDDLFLQLEGTYLNYEQERLFDNRTAGSRSLNSEDGDSLDFLAKLDGALISLPGGEAKFSLGGGYSKQTFKSGTAILPDTVTDFTSFDRDSYFAFAEVFAPLVGEEQNFPGINRLELNGAARYTEYSDFGDAWTPRVGLLWSPVDGLNLRGTYARAFRAPTLRELDPSSGFAQVIPLTFFGFPDTFSSDGSSVALFWANSVRDDLTPEFSDTMTLGFDIEPAAVPGFKLSATYFNIDYTDRLGLPAGIEALLDQESFAFAFNPSPTLNDFTQVVDSVKDPIRFSDPFGLVSDPTDPAAVAAAVTVIFDARPDNLAESKVEGIDVAFDYSHESSIGALNYGVRITNTLTSTQRAVPVSPEVSLLDTVGNPVSFRFRGFAGLRRGGFSSQVNVNYIDNYTNVSVAPTQSVDSWTTVDLNMRYSFADHNSVLLNDLALALTVQNLLDADPPFVETLSIRGVDGLAKSVGFDPVNANPVGRFVTVSLTKKF